MFVLKEAEVIHKEALFIQQWLKTKKRDLLITPLWQKSIKALFITPWRPHDILVAVVLSKQNYIKETIYIFSKYGPLRINIYRGLGKNWFHINADYLNEKLDNTVKDKGRQKNVRPVALFAGTEKRRYWESAWNPDP